MLGAIIGDIVGSRFECTPAKTKDFQLFTEDSCLTDDSMMTLAVGCACTRSDLSDEADFKSRVIYHMRKIGREYPFAGYGQHFFRWLKNESMGPYNSFGNGSAMRVCPVAWSAQSLAEAERLAKWSAEVTHNHPEGIRGAQAVSAAVYLARVGKSKDEIRDYIEKNYYSLDFTLDQIRPAYRFDVTCQGSVPQAIRCFLEAADFEDAIRNAVSLGGDADTQAAMAGAIAEAFWGIPPLLKEEAFRRFSRKLRNYYDMICANNESILGGQL